MSPGFAVNDLVDGGGLHSELVGELSLRDAACDLFPDVANGVGIELGDAPDAILARAVGDVISVRAKKEARRTDAETYVTRVKDLECGGNRSSEHEPRDAVSGDPLSANAQSAIAAVVNASKPCPAVRRLSVDILHEALKVAPR